MIHVIASLRMRQPQTKYRRNHLANYLFKQKDADNMLSVYRVSATLRKPFK